LREDVKQARKDFQEAQKTWRDEDIITVDEMGCVTGMSRAYGYAPCGKRAVSYEPGGKGHRLSLIGALSFEGFLGGLEIEGSVNGDVFEAFVEQVLVPQLRPGKVVIWDNVSFHRRESLRELIEAHGATVKFLPAYSPELNPIEECWSKLKAWLRKQVARTIKALQEAITEAIQQMTLKDIEGWFRHAGYQANTNE
jgi:transposase